MTDAKRARSGAKMDNRTLLRKLNQLAALANELDAVAKDRYGPGGNLFYEAEGNFHVMSGDSDGGIADRQTFIEMSSTTTCSMGCGGW